LVIIFSPFNAFLTIFLIVSSVLGLIGVLHAVIDHGCNPIRFRKLNESGFIHWWVYATPVGILAIILVALVGSFIKGITKFNRWLNS
jgi:hypothetical protein